MFCKRCDGAYHCYCQQPPHKVRWVSCLCNFSYQSISLYISLVKHVECWPWALLVSKTYEVSQLWFYSPWKWHKCSVWVLICTFHSHSFLFSWLVSFNYMIFDYLRLYLLLIWISTLFICFGTVYNLLCRLCMSGKLDIAYLEDWWIRFFHE